MDSPHIPLSAEEIAEAQRLGILPGPQNNLGRALPRALEAGLASGARAVPPAPAAVPPMPSATPSANVGQISAVSAPNPAPTRPPVASVASTPARRGPAVVPRVQLDPATAPTSPLSRSLAAQREKYNTQLDRLMAPPDYNQLSAQMVDRSRAGMDDLYASALAGLGPEAIQGFQQPLLKQALAARSPMSIEGGQIDAEGRVMLDPAFQRNKVADQLRNRLAQIDQQERLMISDAEKAALSHERNLIMLQMRQISAAMAQQNMGASTYGFTPDGKRIVEDRQGNQFVMGTDGSRTRYTGPSVPKTAFEKNVQSVMTLQGNVNKADALIKLAEDNADAFGIIPAAISMTPDIVQQRLMPKALTPDQLAARNYIQRQAADEIHQIYGAALTMGEGQRAAQWAIGPRDSVESTIAKLRSARDWAAQTMLGQGSAANQFARERVNPSGYPPAPQGYQPPAGNPGQSGGLPPGWSVRER